MYRIVNIYHYQNKYIALYNHQYYVYKNILNVNRLSFIKDNYFASCIFVIL